MSVELKSLSTLNQEATHILVKEMGVVDAIRFLSQFMPSSSDYTKDREQWLDELTLDQITAEIKSSRSKNA